MVPLELPEADDSDPDPFVSVLDVPDEPLADPDDSVIALELPEADNPDPDPSVSVPDAPDAVGNAVVEDVDGALVVTGTTGTTVSPTVLILPNLIL